MLYAKDLREVIDKSIYILNRTLFSTLFELWTRTKLVHTHVKESENAMIQRIIDRLIE